MAPSLSLTQLQYTAAGLLAQPANRQDGRSLLSFRPIQIATASTSQQAAGSAQCTLGATSCSVVVSAEVVQEEDCSAASLFNCTVDVDQSTTASVNLNTLLVTLQKALTNAIRSTFDQEQLVILRRPNAGHEVIRAWRLHVDALIHDVGGGNVADCLFACAHAALRDVRLPKTHPIGFDVSSLRPDGEQRMDIFDVRGSRTRTGKAQPAHVGSASDRQVQKAGVDFEISDVAVPLNEAATFPVGVTVNVLGDDGLLLLDATQIEEACIPYARRVLVLCNPSDSAVAGTYMLAASFETGANQLGEERNGKGTNTSIVGTCDYNTIRQAIKAGQQFAKGLHAAIEAQIVKQNDVQMSMT